ncbi:MAG TPA: DNA double-strand break repair nuclease NurA [Candidatus Thermoplasmatota archaeon]|nr:DNA double-strand break repair nuclease NurA [Candidatus Thermoplasmatota archaeon]
MDDIARLLASLAPRLRSTPPDSGLAFETVVPRPPGRIGAVDGSVAPVLEGQGFVVSAVRAVAILVEDGRVSAVHGPRALLHVTAREIDADRRREEAEREAAGRLLSFLGPGDLLLLDGALAVPDGSHETLVQACQVRGIVVAAVCKSTSALLDGAPLLPAALAQGTRRRPGEAWYADVSHVLKEPGVRSFVARLHAAARQAFRIDLPAAGVAPDEALSRIAATARDPGYPGYPWPLAQAHNRAAIPDSEADDLAHAIRSRALQDGIDAGTWDACFADPHAMLDAGR